MKTNNNLSAPPPDPIIRLTTVADAYAAGQAAGAALRDHPGAGDRALDQLAGHDPRARALTLEIDQSTRMVIDRHAAIAQEHEAKTAAAEDAKRRATKRLNVAEQALHSAEADLAAFVNSFPAPGGAQ